MGHEDDEPACYYPYMGKIFRNYGRTPCRKPNGPGDIVNCCAAGDICLDNNTCLFTTQAGSNHSQTGFTIASCTDPDYSDPRCSMHCANGAHTDIIYNDDSSTWSCCESNPDYEYEGWDCKANPSGEAWGAPAPAKLSTLAIIPSNTKSPPIVVATSYTAHAHKSSATLTVESKSGRRKPTPAAEYFPQRTAQSLPLANPTPGSSKESGLSTGAKAGIGVGVTAGLVVILLLVAWFFFRKRLLNRFFSRQKIPSLYEKSADDHEDSVCSDDGRCGQSSNQYSAEKVNGHHQPHPETGTVGAYYTGPVILPKGSPPGSSGQHQRGPIRAAYRYEGGARSENATPSPDAISPPSAHPGSTVPNCSYGLTPHQPMPAPIVRQPQYPSARRHVQNSQTRLKHQAELPAPSYLEHGLSTDRHQQESDLQGAVMAASHPSVRSRRPNRKHSSRRRRNGKVGGPHVPAIGNALDHTQNQYFTSSAPPFSHIPRNGPDVREKQDGDESDDSLTETDDEFETEEADILIHAPWHPNNPQTEIQELPTAEREVNELPTTEMKDASSIELRNSRHPEEKGGFVYGKEQIMKELPKPPIKDISSPRQPKSRSQSQYESPGLKGNWTGSPRDRGLRKR